MLGRRQFFTAMGGAALASCASRPRLPAPNILVLMPDQFRGMDLRVMGNPDVQTPNMDRLAAEGALLRKTYANCPVCCPARGTLLTGKYAHSHGVDVNDAPLADEQQTIAEILREQGYRTGFVGKWHLEGGRRQPGFVPPGTRRQGFEFWAANICSHQYWNMHYFRDDPEPIPMPGYSAKTFTDEAIGFIEQESEQPFLLFLQWGPPHNPYVAPPEYMNLYDPEAITLRPNWVEGARFGSRNDLAGYYAAITFIDDEIGRVLEALEAGGKANDTIILLTSDHGDMLGSHGEFLKRKPWEESVLVPGIVRYPAGIPAGVEPDVLLSHVDVVPTLLGLARVGVPEAIEGADLSRYLFSAEQGGETPDDGAPDAVYLQSYTPTEADQYPPWRGIRTSRYTYARHEQGPWLLFDNEADAYQIENLAEDPASAATVEELDRRTMAHFERTGDSWRERRDAPYR